MEKQKSVRGWANGKINVNVKWNEGTPSVWNINTPSKRAGYVRRGTDPCVCVDAGVCCIFPVTFQICFPRLFWFGWSIASWTRPELGSIASHPHWTGQNGITMKLNELTFHTFSPVECIFSWKCFFLISKFFLGQTCQIGFESQPGVWWPANERASQSNVALMAQVNGLNPLTRHAINPRAYPRHNQTTNNILVMKMITTSSHQPSVRCCSFLLSLSSHLSLSRSSFFHSSLSLSSSIVPFSALFFY